jgi:hypothetical protein
MATYIISYDIPETSDCQSLIERIKQYGTWAHITQSTWAVVSSDTASTIRDALNSFIPEGGRLIVVQTANIAAWNNTLCTNDWLQKNI